MRKIVLSFILFIIGFSYSYASDISCIEKSKIELKDEFQILSIDYIGKNGNFYINQSNNGASTFSRVLYTDNNFIKKTYYSKYSAHYGISNSGEKFAFYNNKNLYLNEYKNIIIEPGGKIINIDDLGYDNIGFIEFYKDGILFTGRKSGKTYAEQITELVYAKIGEDKIVKDLKILSSKYMTINKLTISDDKNNYAYAGKTSNGFKVILNGVELNNIFSDISDIVFNSDFTKITYAYSLGKNCGVYKDGILYKELSGGSYYCRVSNLGYFNNGEDLYFLSYLNGLNIFIGNNKNPIIIETNSYGNLFYKNNKLILNHLNIDSNKTRIERDAIRKIVSVIDVKKHTINTDSKEFKTIDNFGVFNNGNIIFNDENTIYFNGEILLSTIGTIKGLGLADSGFYYTEYLNDNKSNIIKNMYCKYDKAINTSIVPVEKVINKVEKQIKINLKSEVELTKELNLLKVKLKDTKYGKILPKFDKKISGFDDKKLLLLKKMLEKFNLNNEKYIKYKNVLTYLKIKILLESYKRNNNISGNDNISKVKNFCENISKGVPGDMSIDFTQIDGYKEGMDKSKIAGEIKNQYRIRAYNRLNEEELRKIVEKYDFLCVVAYSNIHGLLVQALEDSYDVKVAMKTIELEMGVTSVRKRVYMGVGLRSVD